MRVLGISAIARAARKRSQGRVAIRLMAKLKSQCRIDTAILENLSRSGAKLEVANPPKQGSQVLLEWHGTEVFGHIAWASTSHCGIIFAAEVPAAVLENALSLDQVAHVPDGLNVDTAAAKAWADGSGKFGFD